jgi:protein-S-isoprenylcysteine O-methyltransferase Ste14
VTTTPPEPTGADPDPAASESSASESSAAESSASESSARSKQPSLAPGAALLVLAGVLIVVVLIKPDMPDWLRTTIAIMAVVVVIGLLAYAFVVFRETTRGGSR